ncbi:FAD-dependent oxidoreductase [Microlunatus sp. GCM10028923]|uniref:FAD-dependent oxidoreductase n=1 Tax=Microlunatus sp. GCM10028923 TaxID=3273400 RepID=UPI0036086CF8
MDSTMLRTTVCIAGGGPAGLMLGLLLARRGVEVVVLEKHADFLRDFRGDTVHPSTQQVLDELGLADRFAELPYQRVDRAETMIDGRPLTLADFGALRTPYPYIAMVPQWDLLNLLAEEAARYPGFRLLHRAEATGLITSGGRVTGVTVRRPDQDQPLEVHAALTVAADGRHSTLRRAAELPSREFGAAFDVLWFRVSRTEVDQLSALGLRVAKGTAYVVVPRNTYWQVARIIDKGTAADLLGGDIAALHQDFRTAVPELADRIGEVTGWDRTSVLEVRIDRLRRWHRPGLLCLGDAAHAMSPVGGVGINLAVQDAVAAANLLTPALLDHQRTGSPVDDHVLAAVQRRRGWPTKITQLLQRAVQRFGVERALRGGLSSSPVPGLLMPPIRRLLSRVIGLGVRPEHVRH